MSPSRPTPGRRPAPPPTSPGLLALVVAFAAASSFHPTDARTVMVGPRQELTQLQEPLHLQAQKAARDLPEMKWKSREKDIITALQQELQETQQRVTSLEERMMDLEGRVREGGLQCLEDREVEEQDKQEEEQEEQEEEQEEQEEEQEEQEEEQEEQEEEQEAAAAAEAIVRPDEAPATGVAAAGGAMKPPSLEGIRPLFKLVSTTTCPATSDRETPAMGGAAAGDEAELPSQNTLPAPVSSSTPTSSGAGHHSVAADEEERLRQRMGQLVQEVQFKMEEARIFALGESLCAAIREGNLTKVENLIDKGANINYINEDGDTPLYCAAFCSRENVLDKLLERGPDVKAVTSSGNSPLHATTYLDASGCCINLLVRKGADVNARNIEGETPLHWAADEGNEKAVQALLEAGARKDIKAWSGMFKGKTPLELAKNSDIRFSLRE